MKISIIIAVYNGEKHIGRAIRSCIEQSIPKNEYEIIVVNDGSADNTKFILDSFNGWIKVINLKKNMGLPYACNMGIKKALGGLVMRVDADDYIHEDLLKIGYLFLGLNSDFDAVAFDYYLVNEKEKRIKRVCAKKHPIACGILFRKDSLMEIGLYDEEFHLREDEDLRLRFLTKFSLNYVPLPLYRYRMHDDNSTKNIKKFNKYKKMLMNKHKLVKKEN